MWLEELEQLEVVSAVITVPLGKQLAYAIGGSNFYFIGLSCDSPLPPQGRHKLGYTFVCLPLPPVWFCVYACAVCVLGGVGAYQV